MAELKIGNNKEEFVGYSCYGDSLGELMLSEGLKVIQASKFIEILNELEDLIDEINYKIENSHDFSGGEYPQQGHYYFEDDKDIILEIITKLKKEIGIK